MILGMVVLSACMHFPYYICHARARFKLCEFQNLIFFPAQRHLQNNQQQPSRHAQNDPNTDDSGAKQAQKSQSKNIQCFESGRQGSTHLKGHYHQASNQNQDGDDSNGAHSITSGGGKLSGKSSEGWKKADALSAMIRDENGAEFYHSKGYAQRKKGLFLEAIDDYTVVSRFTTQRHW